MINYWIAERVSNLRELSHIQPFLTLDEPKMTGVLNNKHKYDKNYDSLSNIDKDRVFKISTPSREMKYQVANVQPYFAPAVAGKEYISDMVIDPNSGLPIINISIPVFDYAGNFQGLILGAVSTKTLERLLSDNWFGETGEVIMVNHEGTMLVDPRYVNDRSLCFYL